MCDLGFGVFKVSDGGLPMWICGDVFKVSDGGLSMWICDDVFVSRVSG
jgi:hypothetical protein